MLSCRMDQLKICLNLHSFLIKERKFVRYPFFFLAFRLFKDVKFHLWYRTKPRNKNGSLAKDCEVISPSNIFLSCFRFGQRKLKILVTLQMNFFPLPFLSPPFFSSLSPEKLTSRWFSFLTQN